MNETRESSLHHVTKEMFHAEITAICKQHLQLLIEQKGEEYQLSQETLRKASEKVEQLQIFRSPLEMIQHVFGQEKLSKLMKTQWALALALLSTSTSALQAKFFNGEDEIQVVALLPMSNLAELSTFLAHELEHVADSLLGLIEKKDLLRGANINVLSTFYQYTSLLAIIPLIQTKIEVISLTETQIDVLFFGLLAVSLLGTLTTRSLYKTIPHEKRAYQAMTDNEKKIEAAGKKANLLQKIFTYLLT